MPRKSRTNDQATLHIRDADIMTKAQRRRIAYWLQAQAKYILRDGDQYWRSYKAHYIREN